jgi:hypothetical protein
MAYDPTVAQPILLVPRVGNGIALWVYKSTDVHTDVDAPGYFANGASLGMKTGDVMIVLKSSATLGATIHYVSSATSIEPAILS